MVYVMIDQSKIKTEDDIRKAFSVWIDFEKDVYVATSRIPIKHSI